MADEAGPLLVLKPDKNKGTIYVSDVVDSLLEIHHYATFQDTDELLVYNTLSGLYLHGAAKLVARELEDAAQLQGLAEKINRHFVSEVIGHLQRATYLPREAFNAHIDLLPVKNGVLNIATREVVPHAAGYYFTTGIPVWYQQEADCPRIAQFLSEIVSEEHVPLLYELFGWCLDLRSPLQRMVLLVGDGANGKSTLVNLLQRLLGDGNCSHVTLQDLASNRFSSSELYGKLANIYPDLPSAVLRDAGMLKALTGGDTISAEKKFKDRFSFRNTAKMVFSANQPPLITEDSTAIWRRLVIVDFPNAFLGARADKNLLAKLTTDDELSGLLNRALDGLARLRSNGDFAYRLTAPEVRAQYRRMSDTPGAFVEEMCELDPDASISKEDLYEAYEQWCDQHRLVKVSKKAFGSRLGGTDAYSMVSGKQRGSRVWIGIRLKERT